MMMTKKKRFFTLLELLICIGVLALMSGVLAFPIREMVQEHRLHQKAKDVKNEIQKVQALALNYQSDMELLIFKKKGIFYCKGVTEEPLNCFQPLALNGLTQISWNGKEITNPQRWKIFSSGRIEPAGVIAFHQGDLSVKLDITNPLWITFKKEKK